MKILNGEIVDKISDAFQSTFSWDGENILINMFYEKEVPIVAAIIRKYVPKADLTFDQIEEITTDYYIWKISIEER